MPIRNVTFVAIAVTVLLSGMVATATAQTADAESAKALRELVAEVRSLRAVIEQYAVAQIQAQSVGEMLNVQQRRVADITSRLDVVRRELEGVSAETRRFTDMIASFDERARRMTDTKERAQLEIEQRNQERQLELLTTQEQSARSRETDLANTLAIEEAKWNELVDRLNQWLRR